jgi:predicted RNase H-like HicB family nuclease
MMNKYGFSIAWSEEDQGYIATCPEFPGLSAFGHTIEQALGEAKAALGLFIKTYKEDGISLPEPQTVQEYSGQFRVRISKEHHRQAVQAAAKEGISLNQFVGNAVAARLGAVDLNSQLANELKQMVLKMEQRLTSAL